MTFQNQLALISPADLQKLVEDSVRKVLAEKSGSAPTGALRAQQAASYIGVGKRKFYYLLHNDPELAQACLRIGAARVWPKAALDAWMERQVAKGQPKKREAA
jgi:predicted DNA-binding transcriptional regulator AlpA